MKPVSKNLIITILTLSSLTGCYHSGQCPVYATENIRVDNQTNTAQTLHLCKGGHSPGVTDQTFRPTPQPIAPQSAYNSLFEVGHYAIGKKDMESDGGCGSPSPLEKSVEVPAALTSASFGVVKLCYDNSFTNKSYIHLVDPNGSCPGGTQEQTQPVDDCTIL